MRPTAGTMLQQNNNNNYPCLSMSDCPREMLQKCSRASLPFPGRMELGDLPLIRGLRAWALCSKNRRKASGLLGGAKAPTAPPLGRGTSASCPRPADVYLSGYGLPLGLDARQAGIGALVTVATLKTSEGSGKTQTQCLFLRTDKGSCLYSTAKPGSGASPSMVGEWLRGKRGGAEGGGGAEPLPAEAGANRVRVRAGRRWRKSGNAAGRERKAASRERQQRSCKKVGASVEERQEEGDNGRLGSKEFPSPQLDNSAARCCDNVSPKACTRKNSWNKLEGEESPARRAASELNLRAKRERQRNEEEGGASGAVLDASNPDLESKCTHRTSNSSRAVDEDQETQRAKGLEELKTQDGLTRRDEDSNTEVLGKRVTGSDSVGTLNDKNAENETKRGAEQEPETEMERLSAASVTRTQESSLPVEGTVCRTDQETFWVHSKQESNQNQLEVELGPEAEQKVEEEPDVCSLRPQEPNRASDESHTVNGGTREPHILLKHEENNSLQEKGALCSPVRQRDLSIPENVEGRIGKPEDAFTCCRLDDGSGDEEEQRSRASGDDWSARSQEPGRCAETNGQESTPVFDGADPPTSEPAPSLPSPASMVTGLLCLEVEEGEAVGVTPGHEGGGPKQKGSPKGELEEKAEEVRGSTGAPEEGRKEEEDEFGVFMQAEGEPAWSEGVNMSASVSSRSRGSTGGSLAISGEDDWTAFAQEPSDERGDAVEQWWPASAAEARRDGPSTNHSLAAVFSEAFPPLLPPSFTPGDSCDPEAVPTLKQLLQGKARPDQGLLDSFHDLNKMIGQSHKRSNGASQSLLLKTLQLQQPLPESRPTSWTTNRRLSPGLSSANQHAAAKRRLSYDYNRNIVQ